MNEGAALFNQGLESSVGLIMGAAMGALSCKCESIGSARGRIEGPRWRTVEELALEVLAISS
jgi:hypothetical protein